MTALDAFLCMENYGCDKLGEILWVKWYNSGERVLPWVGVK